MRNGGNVMARRKDPIVELLADIVAASRSWPDRAQRALDVLADAQSPLNGSSLNVKITGSGTSDRTGEMATDSPPDVRAERRELRRAIMEFDKQSRRVQRILDEYAPSGGKPTPEASAAANAPIWCANSNHGTPTPKDGAYRHCRWCRQVKSDWGHLPTGPLCDLHERGVRLSEADYRRHFRQT